MHLHRFDHGLTVRLVPIGHTVHLVLWCHISKCMSNQFHGYEHGHTVRLVLFGLTVRPVLFGPTVRPVLWSNFDACTQRGGEREGDARLLPLVGSSVAASSIGTKAVSHPCRAIRDVEGIHKGLHAHLIHPRGAIGNIDDVDEDHQM